MTNTHELSLPAPLPTDDDIMNTVFVSGIAPGIKDSWIQKILSSCGKVSIWKRPHDTRGKDASFGFCVYKNQTCILRALRVIDGEDQEFEGGIELEGSDGPKKLRLQISDEARAAAEAAIRDEKVEKELDRECYAKILQILETIKSEVADDFLSTLAPMPIDSVKKEDVPFNFDDAMIEDPLDDMPPEVTQEQKDEIRREIALFRQNTAIKDHERTEREIMHASEERRRATREFERERQRKQRDEERKGGKLFASNGVEITKGVKSLSKEDEEEERRRKARRQEELMRAFKEREAKFEQHEADRGKRLAQADKKVQEYEEDVRKNKEKDRAWLHDYNDLEEKYYDDFYRDRYIKCFYIFRERWISRRKRDLAREREDEDKDIQTERALEEEERAQKEAQMVPEVMHVGKIMTKEERMGRIKELVDRIPTDKESLWKWQVKWEFLSSNLLENKLTPFVAKKVVEYIGSEEKDLVEHTIQAVASRSGAQAVLNELQGALAEDAEIFVIKLWRMVVYETEARSQGIS